ncbi:hypothetical protein VB713_28315 [Anabaena cylindrica UHCC 0172]|uniref:hypothetical protein n=1 Tax=Anabaena cylindrica TaxID=1165 RepID=UPI002B1EA924|nr:hypothetical protein [Anabaena cylindrica]MEA5554832.1 hypothetical protein [Anabaena cylindrica UHCC 0172]
MKILEQIAVYLRERKWQYILDEEHQCIMTGVASENLQKLIIIIKLSEDGEYFEITIPELFTGLKTYPHQNMVFKTMLAIASETKMLRWEYKTTTDAVNAKIEFPLEDAQLTQKQFERCLDSLVQLVDEIAIPRLLQVMETGEDPGDIKLGERLLLTLSEILPEGSLNLLEQALKARKLRGKIVGEN